MKLNRQKRTILILAAVFVLLFVLYFAVIRPLTRVEDDRTTELDMLEGEVRINDIITNFYMYQPIERASIQSITVENEFGGYKIYRDAADNFQLDGFLGLTFDPEKFSSLVVTTGTPTVIMRVADHADADDLTEYGFDDPQASWTLTDISGKETKVYVGDRLLTEGGYYVMLDGRDAVYIMGSTLETTILQPAYSLLRPLISAGMAQNNYFFVDSFMLWHGEDLFVNVAPTPDDQKRNPDALVEASLLYPLDEDGNQYQINDSLYFEILYQFMAMEGDEVLAFLPTDEELVSFGLDNPAYTIRYTFTDPETKVAYEFVIFVSEKQPDGTYNAVSNLLGFSVVCKVANEKLNWLEKDVFSWIFPTPFFVNIQDVSRITLSGSGIDVDFSLTHGFAADGQTPTLDVREAKSGTEIPDKDIKNFREYYKTLLNITNQEYATLSREDRFALTQNDDNLLLTMTYENQSGMVNEYKFYKYVETSTGKISSGKIFVTVNGVGEFYTTNDLVNKIINDTPRVLEGLDIDAYRHN